MKTFSEKDIKKSPSNGSRLTQTLKLISKAIRNGLRNWSTEIEGGLNEALGKTLTLELIKFQITEVGLKGN